MEKITVKKVDTENYLDIIKELVREGGEIPVLISGNSMSPFLVDQRDIILISPVERPLKKGDMAFYQRMSGQYVMHRICRVCHRGGCEQYYFIGDAQTEIEGPISREYIFGVITAVRRKGKWLKPGNFWWEFFRCIWLNIIPMRSMAQKTYGVIKNLCRSLA